MIQWMLAIWSLVPLPCLNPASISESFRFMYFWTLLWMILSITSLAMWNECNCAVVWTFFSIALLWDLNENWSFPGLWPLLSFPNLLAYWVQHFNSIIWQTGLSFVFFHTRFHHLWKGAPIFLPSAVHPWKFGWGSGQLHISLPKKKKSSDHWGVNRPQFFQDCMNLRSLSYEPDLGMQDCTVPTITQVHLSRPYSACSSMPGLDTHHLNPPGHSCKEGVSNTLQISLNLESHTE